MEYCSPKKCEYRRVDCDVLPLSNPEVTATCACADCGVTKHRCMTHDVWWQTEPLPHVLWVFCHSCPCALPGSSGQRQVFSLHSSVLLQHRHQDVRGVRLLGLRGEQQQLRVEAELHGRVCSRCVKLERMRRLLVFGLPVRTCWFERRNGGTPSNAQLSGLKIALGICRAHDLQHTRRIGVLQTYCSKSSCSDWEENREIWLLKGHLVVLEESINPRILMT